jgi:phenylpyruvate tautomerase PptA (4-oxalocrotonate tautomerase family)
MPCNAIATARAQVSQENLAALLTDDVVRTFLTDYLKRRYPSLSQHEEKAWAGVLFVVGNYRVHVNEGRVTVTATWRGDEATCKTLASEITAVLTRAAGAIFQAKMTKAIRARYTVSESSFAQNGALVLSVEL